jgi:hypothetical protein
LPRFRSKNYFKIVFQNRSDVFWNTIYSSLHLSNPVLLLLKFLKFLFLTLESVHRLMNEGGERLTLSARQICWIAFFCILRFGIFFSNRHIFIKINENHNETFISWTRQKQALNWYQFHREGSFFSIFILIDYIEVIQTFGLITE